VPPDRPGRQQTLVHLSCIDDDSQGTELDVLWEREIDARVLPESGWTDLGRKGFDPPHLFSAFVHALRWNLVTSTNPRLFQSPYRAGIEVMAYQLEPLRKALMLPRVNLFIADDVGLGKTIEAGLIIRELLMRQKVIFAKLWAVSSEPTAPTTGIDVWMFPEWFVAQYEIQGPGKVRSRPLIHREALVSNKWLGPDKKKYPVVPIRFVQACLNGHISDIDWYGFVHDFKEDCKRQLYVDERGTTSDLSDITIRCECGKSKLLIVATQNPKAALGFCKGWRPWLGNNSREQCGGGNSGAQINRLLIRSAI